MKLKKKYRINLNNKYFLIELLLELFGSSGTISLHFSDTR